MDQHLLTATDVGHGGATTGAGNGTGTVTAASYGGDNGERVGVADRRVLTLEISDVLVVYVNINERAKFAFIGEQVATEIGMLRGEHAKRFPDGRPRQLYRGLFARIRAQWSWNQDSHGLM